MSSINRKPHCLKREKTLAMPRHLIFFDVETKQERLPNGSIKQVLKLGWACHYQRSYGRNSEQSHWCYFEDEVGFWQFVYRYTKPKHKLWVLSRNLVFDFTLASGWKYLRQVGFKLKFFYDGGSTSIISVRGRYGSIVFLDIMNWFVESLKKTGERIGIPKLTIDFDTCSDEYLSTYCKRDVEIEVENFKRLIKFLESNSISRLCYTRGSTAMAAYLFSHYDTKIYIHNNEQAINLERDSYRGGRTECFYLGELKDETYYMVDVNSLYPFVMRNNLYPTKYCKIMSNCTLETLAGWLETHSVVSKVFINTDEPAYAVSRKRTIFPIGQFWVTLTTPELKYALEHNHILKIERTVIYEQANIFKSYVDRFYALRQEFKSAGVPEYDELCKKMLNSLYGKFGQKAEIWEKVGVCPKERDRVEVCFLSDGGRTKMIRYLLGEIFELKGHEECFNSFPAIASQVSAYARMYLWKLMQCAGEGNYFYCDTDSLIVNNEGLWNLWDFLDDVRLGGLKVDKKIPCMIIKGLKDYVIGSKQVIKGIRKNAVEIEVGVYEQEQWPSFKGLLRSDNAEDYIVKTVKKVLKRNYTKGHVNPDGTILPLQLAEPVESPFLFC